MKIYVGNLPWTVDDEKLESMFSTYGEVAEATVIKDKFSGRSKGFGFVTFNDDAAAQKAIAEMNDKDIEGRRLKVNEAKPMDPDRPRPPRRDFGGDRGGSRGGDRGGSRGGYGGGDRRRF
jgi:RNA recognition motif-containing protein